MRSYRKKSLLIVSLFVLFTLYGCQQTPKTEAITSKNNGAFDTNAIQSAAETHTPGATQEAVFADCFYSTDKTVEYLLNISNTLADLDMPVIEVNPHYLTDDDARRVAEALFGDVEFYEADPLLAPIYSKEDIQEKLSRWIPYTSQASVDDLYGEHKERVVDIVKEFISDYTEMFETAPDKKEASLCKWQFKKVPYYLMSASEADAVDTSTETDSIQAMLKIGQLPYRYNVETRNQADYKANYINAYLYDGTSPYFIDDRIFYATLCRTEKPSDSQVSAIRATAEYMLIQMDLGEWKIDECYVETCYYGDNTEYIICINAVPVLNGIEALRQSQPFDLTSDDVYASNYSMTDVNFQFAPNGELLNFVLYSPIDIYDIINDNVAVLEINELVEKAKETLSYADYYNYDPGFLINMVNEEVQCVVDICELVYNLNRIRVPNTEDHYYYVPGVTLKGNVEFIGKESGKLYYYSEEPISLVSVNAVDGSIIATS